MDILISMKTTFHLVMWLLLSSCGIRPAKMYLRDFTEVPEVVSAVQKLNASKGCDIVRLSEGGYYELRWGYFYQGIIGYFDGDHTIYIKARETGAPYDVGQALELTIIHELGHAFGEQHSSDPCDIMYPEALGGCQYSAEALKKLTDRIGNCNVHERSYK